MLRFFFEFAIHKLLETPLLAHSCIVIAILATKLTIQSWILISTTVAATETDRQLQLISLFEKYDGGIFYLIAFWVLFTYQIFPDSNLDSSKYNSFKGLFITQRLLCYVFDCWLNERLALWTFFLLVHIKFMNVKMNSSAIKEFQFRYKNVKLMQWMTPWFSWHPLIMHFSIIFSVISRFCNMALHILSLYRPGLIIYFY